MSRLLDYINHDDWAEHDGFLVFGKGAFENWSETLQTDEDDLKAAEAMREFSTNWEFGQGKRALAKRVKLGLLPADSTLSDAVQLLKRFNPAVDERKMRKSLGTVLATVPHLPRDSELDCLDFAGK